MNLMLGIVSGVLWVQLLYAQSLEEDLKLVKEVTGVDLGQTLPKLETCAKGYERFDSAMMVPPGAKKLMCKSKDAEIEIGTSKASVVSIVKFHKAYTGKCNKEVIKKYYGRNYEIKPGLEYHYQLFIKSKKSPDVDGEAICYKDSKKIGFRLFYKQSELQKEK